MPNFRYKAIDDAGNLIRGSIVTSTESKVEAELKAKGITLVECKATKTSGSSRFVSRKVAPRVIIEFYHRLSQTLELGLPILSALNENAKTLPSRYFRYVISEIRIAVENGNMLCAAMAHYPKIFDKLDLAVMRLGEETGVLPSCLKDLADFKEWREDLRSTIKRATIYPAFILLAVATVIAVWAGFVLPQLTGILNEMGVAIPRATQIIIQISFFLRNQWFVILIVLAVLAGGFYLFQKSEYGGILIHKYLLRMPIIGRAATSISMARFSHNFATMYSAGMNIHSIFHILSRDVLANRYLEKCIARAYQEIQGGKSIAASFEAVGAFPPLLIGAINNGESTGALGETLHRMGDYYDNDVKRLVKTMVSAIEPLATILLGGIFGIIILSILLPLYDVIVEFTKG